MGHASRTGQLVIESPERTAEPASDSYKEPTAIDRLRDHRITRWFADLGVFFRDKLHEPVRSHPVFGVPYRVFVAVVGIAIVLLGLVLVPAPGPGWLIVIGGLGVLSTEFSWARRLLHFTRRTVSAWTEWVLRQPLAFRMLIGALGFVMLVAGLLTSLAMSGWTGFPFS
jgi:uncharacterized protein (TIGR02611 family)